MNDRTLRLKREVLAEIDTAGLTGVVGGDGSRENTCYSCLDYISCWKTQCVARDLVEHVGTLIGPA